MSAFFEISLVFFACIGILSAVWMLVGVLLRPRDASSLTVVSKPQSLAEITAVIQRFEWSRQWGVDLRLVFLTDDMDEAMLVHAAHYARQELAVELCVESVLCRILSPGVD